MKQMHKRFPIRVLALLVLVAGISWAQSDFLVKQVDVEGAHRIPKATVLNYAKIQVGQDISAAALQQAIRALYATGLFRDVVIKRAGDRLVLSVVEQPVIHEVVFSGNKSQRTKPLLESLRKVGVEKAKVLNEAKLTHGRQLIVDQYKSQGYQNVSVDYQVSAPEKGLVNVKFNIVESKPTRIRKIILVGNTHVSSSKLIANIGLGASWWQKLVGQRVPYDQNTTDLALEKLIDYYKFDQGFMDVRVETPVAQFDKDKLYVILTIKVIEGQRYSFKRYDIKGGVSIPDAIKEKLEKILIPDRPFARGNLIAARSVIERYFQNQGFAFLSIDIHPQLDNVDHTVFVTFQVNAGKPILVHQISFKGNNKTASYVLRRAVKQLEGAIYSQDNIETSVWRLNNMGYLKGARWTVKPVDGHEDWVDLEFEVTESPSATANIQFSYGELQHFMVSLGLNESNVLGTGNALNFNLSQSRFESIFSIHYLSPYYLKWGMSRDINLYAKRRDNGKEGASHYRKDVIGLSYGLGLPIAERWRIRSSGAFESDRILGDDSFFSEKVANYLAKYGRHYSQYSVSSGLAYMGLDRSLFPLKGVEGSVDVDIGLPISSDSAAFYTISSDLSWFQPLYDFGHEHRLIFNPKLHLGFGHGYARQGSELPFFKNFYAGGMGSVRGFSANSLGPKDSRDDPFGGNLLTVMNLNMVIPSPSEDKLRLALFVDGGNVFHDHWVASEMRYSTGISFQALVPIPFVIALAHPLDAKVGDSKRQFDLTIGTSF